MRIQLLRQARAPCWRFVNVTAGAFQAEFSDAVYVATGAVHGSPIVHMVLDLQRSFCHRALRDAVAHGIDKFPVLGCRYETRFFRDRWVPDSSPVDSVIHCEESGEDSRQVWLEHWVNQPIDPTCTRPLRVVQRKSSTGATLLISVAHAASDGAGIIAFVHELACSLCGAPSRAETSPERGIRQLVRALSGRQLAALPAGVVQEGLRPLKLARLADRRRPAATSGSRASRVKTIVLEGPAYEAFRRSCTAVGATINDGLAAVMAQLGTTQSDAAVPIYYTANLRRVMDAPKAIAGNLSGGEVMLLAPDALGSLSEAARAAASVTSVTKSGAPGLGLVVFQWLTVGWLPHALLRNLAVPQLAASSLSLFRKSLVLTNCGALDRYLEPFGSDLLAASVMGPFADAFPVPVVVTTGLRSSLTLQICVGSGFPEQELEQFAEQLTQLLHAPSSEPVATSQPSAA